jgi:hypothetical protein
MWETATRPPLLSLFLLGLLFLLREAQRKLFSLGLFHEPPRSTRTPRPAPATKAAQPLLLPIRLSYCSTWPVFTYSSPQKIYIDPLRGIPGFT